MILAHLGDLHLGYRAYRRLENGRNARERDVARVFERSIQELVRLEPSVVLLVGDVFDHPNPPPSALVTLARGVESLRSGLPGVRVLVAAGRRDTPFSPADPGPVAALEGLAGVEAAAGTARSVHLEELGLHVLLVPYRALVEEPFPELRPDPEARWNVLVVPGEPGGAGPRIRPSEWDYVALGGGHSHRELAPGVHRAGSLERVGPSPWDEAAEEKGFVTWDLEAGAFAFHLVPGRPVVELAPTPVDPGDPGSINERIREVVEGIPGGVDDKVVRLAIEGLAPREQELLDARYLARIRKRALHLHVEVQPRSPPPARPPARNEEWLLQRIRQELEGPGEAAPEDVDRVAEEARRLLDRASGEILGNESPETERRGASFFLTGTDPILGRVSLELPPGLVAVVTDDHRTRDALGRLAARVLDQQAGELASQLLHHSGSRDPEELVEAATRLAARSPALGLVEGVLADLSPGSAEPGPSGPPAGAGGGGPEEELLRLAGRIRKLEGIPEELRSLERELRELRATAAEVGGDLEFRTMEWLRERQDAETQLQAYRDRARELKSRYREIESAGEAAPCPTCGRPLDDHRDEVIAELREEWEAVVQDGQWWKRRREQLEPKPEHLQELESRSVRLHAAIEELAERVERRRAELDDVEDLREREASLRKRLDPEGAEGSENQEPSARSVLRRALKQIRGELLREARARILLRAGALVGRISQGRYGGLTEADGSLHFVQDGSPARILSDPDRGMVRLALRLAGGREARAAGVDLPFVPVGSDLEALEDDEWEAAVWCLRGARERLGRLLVVSRAERVEEAPDAFDAVLELHPADVDEEGGPRVRSVPVVPALVRLG